jgi:hypothetical protein
MNRYPVWLSGEVDLRELLRIFRSAGYHVHSDNGGRMVVDRVPEFLRIDAPVSNVVPMKRRVKTK